jgi:hypothetical protein
VTRAAIETTTDVHSTENLPEHAMKSALKISCGLVTMTGSAETKSAWTGEKVTLPEQPRLKWPKLS